MSFGFFMNLALDKLARNGIQFRQWREALNFKNVILWPRSLTIVHFWCSDLQICRLLPPVRRDCMHQACAPALLSKRLSGLRVRSTEFARRRRVVFKSFNTDFGVVIAVNCRKWRKREKLIGYPTVADAAQHWTGRKGIELTLKLRRQDSNLNCLNQNQKCCRLHHDGSLRPPVKTASTLDDWAGRLRTAGGAPGPLDGGKLAIAAGPTR